MFLISIICAIPGAIAAYYAWMNFKANKGDLYKETPVEINFLIPSTDKYELQWAKQGDSERRVEEVAFPTSRDTRILIISIDAEKKARVSLGAINIGFEEEYSTEGPKIVALRGVMKEPAIGKPIRNKVVPNWHGNIGVAGGKLLGGTQLIGLEVKLPEKTARHHLRVGVPCAEAEESKVKRLSINVE